MRNEELEIRNFPDFELNRIAGFSMFAAFGGV